MPDPELRAERAARRAPRCAYCHDALDEARARACSGCATLVHGECLAAAGGCPTLGCAQAPARGGRARWEEPRPRPAGRRARPFERELPFVGLVGAILVPLVCFAANEAGLGRLLSGGLALPGWDLGPWRELYAPTAHRPLYPLIAFAMAAYLGAAVGHRRRWVALGLVVGVVVALGFCALYAPVLHVAAVSALFFGAGLLGLGPYLALGCYVAQAVSHLRAREPADPQAWPEEKE